MGRIKTRFVKSSAAKIFESGKDELSTDFSKNKQIVDKYADIPSKRLRNTVIGQLTRLKKRSDAEE